MNNLIHEITEWQFYSLLEWEGSITQISDLANLLEFSLDIRTRNLEATIFATRQWQGESFYQSLSSVEQTNEYHWNGFRENLVFRPFRKRNPLKQDLSLLSVYMLACALIRDVRTTCKFVTPANLRAATSMAFECHWRSLIVINITNDNDTKKRLR